VDYQARGTVVIEPPDIETLDTLPGRQWKDADILRLKHWWLDRPQLKIIWFHAVKYLGRGAMQEDIEDAVMEFFSLFDSARLSYEPGGPRFRTYLLHVCFKNHCIHAGKKIRLRHQREFSMSFDRLDGTEYELILEELSTEHNPVLRVQHSALLSELTVLLNGDRFTVPQKQTFLLRYFEGYSYEEIAQTLGVPLGSVKGWLHRATTHIHQHFRERGWFE
jgi:RNA polymerase sigma factor (sigma-70 family)